MNVLVINGHPRENSFSQALVAAFAEGARQAGARLTCLDLHGLSFNPNVTHASPRHQEQEPAILQARDLIAQAQHLVFIYPTWWGTMPALLKGFIDRVFTAGFAFEETEGGTGYEPLLRGKTAQLITTMDTPGWVYQLVYRAPGHNAMRRAILEFCGFEMSRTLRLGPVRNSTLAQRRQWLDQVRREGLHLQHGALSPWKKARIQAWNWIKALRLQFYPMVLLAYALGALGAGAAGYGFQPLLFWLGYAWLFLVEAATVFSNEYLDLPSDQQNKYYSPFTGGSRVLVDQVLQPRALKKAVYLALALSLVLLAFLGGARPGSLPEMALACGLLYVLALGYTVPPLRLSYRSLGELDVALTHSFGVIVCGYVFQGGPLADALPWLLGLPLFLAILPSIILSGIPDYEADLAAGKKTLAVRLAPRGAAHLALACTWLAAGCVLLFQVFGVLPGLLGHLAWPALAHAGVLSWLLWQYLHQASLPRRIDGLMVAALTYLIWFALVPFLHLI
ncbi:MAG: NAD(P)H-dependent oxidoreductase [Adhaeribacter sp.]